MRVSKTRAMTQVIAVPSVSTAKIGSANVFAEAVYARRRSGNGIAWVTSAGERKPGAKAASRRVPLRKNTSNRRLSIAKKKTVTKNIGLPVAAEPISSAAQEKLAMPTKGT